VVLDVTARNPKAQSAEQEILFTASKTYFEIGRDMQNRMRYGAWQIKDIVDLTLQPMQQAKEQFLINFDTDIEQVEITTTLTYFISGKSSEIVHQHKELIEFELY